MLSIEKRIENAKNRMRGKGNHSECPNCGYPKHKRRFSGLDRDGLGQLFREAAKERGIILNDKSGAK